MFCHLFPHICCPWKMFDIIVTQRYNNIITKKFNSKLELTRIEVERLEHTIIESGKARVGGNIQYVPNVRII